jgi:hypothetical protein
MISLENPGLLKINATKQADVNRHFFMAILSVGLTDTDHSGKFPEGSRVRPTSGLIPQRPFWVGFCPMQCDKASGSFAL